jgi:hypothetical protein
MANKHVKKFTLKENKIESKQVTIFLYQTSKD